MMLIIISIIAIERLFLLLDICIACNCARAHVIDTFSFEIENKKQQFGVMTIYDTVEFVNNWSWSISIHLIVCDVLLVPSECDALLYIFRTINLVNVRC